MHAEPGFKRRHVYFSLYYFLAFWYFAFYIYSNIPKQEKTIIFFPSSLEEGLIQAEFQSSTRGFHLINPVKSLGSESKESTRKILNKFFSCELDNEEMFHLWNFSSSGLLPLRFTRAVGVTPSKFEIVSKLKQECCQKTNLVLSLSLDSVHDSRKVIRRKSVLTKHHVSAVSVIALPLEGFTNQFCQSAISYVRDFETAGGMTHKATYLLTPDHLSQLVRDVMSHHLWPTPHINVPFSPPNISGLGPSCEQLQPFLVSAHYIGYMYHNSYIPDKQFSTTGHTTGHTTRDNVNK